jgi:hypothetical protein
VTRRGVCDAGCDAPARLYTCGWRCEDCAPRPRPPVPDPARTLDGLRAAAGLPVHPIPGRAAGWAAIDARAIASGKRRSNPQDYAAARAVVDQQKQRRTK